MGPTPSLPTGDPPKTHHLATLPAQDSVSHLNWHRGGGQFLILSPIPALCAPYILNPLSSSCGSPCPRFCPLLPTPARPAFSPTSPLDSFPATKFLAGQFSMITAKASSPGRTMLGMEAAWVPREADPQARSEGEARFWAPSWIQGSSLHRRRFKSVSKTNLEASLPHSFPPSPLLGHGVVCR